MNNSSFHHNSSFNVTLEKLPLPSIHFGIAKIVCSLPGLVINIVFIVTIFRHQRLRKNLALLTLLAFGDLLLAGSCLALGISDILTSEKLFHLSDYECFYKRPHMVLLIWGTNLESISTLFVAIERTVAVMFPFFYVKHNKDKIVKIVCAICILFVLTSFLISIIITYARRPFVVYQDLCYPSTAVSEYYGGFIYALTIILGSIALLCYVGVFVRELHSNFKSKQSNDTKFAGNQRSKQIWLLKISFILACSAFVLIVIPYTILFIGRYDRSQTTFVGVVRRYVNYFMAANSFVGMMICVMASPELKSAMKTTILCRELERPTSATASARTRTSRISVSFGNYMDEPV